MKIGVGKNGKAIYEEIGESEVSIGDCIIKGRLYISVKDGRLVLDGKNEAEFMPLEEKKEVTDEVAKS